MKKFNNIRNRIRNSYYSVAAGLTVLSTSAFADDGKTAYTSDSFDKVVKPIVGLINDLMGPALALVGALGSLYCVLLGVKFAKAEEPQEREKAKSNLKGAVIGFVLIFVLLLALNLSMPILQDWVKTSTNQKVILT